MNKYLIPASVVVIIAIAVVSFMLISPTGQGPSNGPTTAVVSPTPTNDGSGMTTASDYTDGTFTQKGNYVSPGGPREVNITITLEDGVITDAAFEGLATDPTSMRFQGEFGDNFEPMIVGRSIDEVELTKVAGSSLTPIGFTDALEKIKGQARS